MKIKGNLLSGYITLACLFLGILLGLSQTASAQLTPLNIQIVNDSGLQDSNVYIMVPGASASESVTPESLFVGKNSGTNTAVALSTLPTTSSLTSTISGNTDKIYTFQVGYISSGAIYFIYNHPFTFAGGVTPSPAPDSGNGGSGYRYDYAELSFVGGTGNNDVDLTYVDKFGIPLQLEWFQGANTAKTNLIDASYVYASTKTLANLFNTYGFTNAIFGLTNSGATTGNISPGWQYNGPASYTNFARIVSPEKANSIGASVSPYPDATNYLNFLITNPFVLNGYSVQGTTVKGNIFATNYLYYYLGYQVSVAANTNGGWTFTMAYNHNLLPTNYNLAAIGAVAGIVGTNVNIPRQYTNTIVFSTPFPYTTNIFPVSTNMISGTNQIVYGTNTVTNLCVGAFIYGAPVGTNYTTNGVAVQDTSHIGYAAEAWMIGDVLSSLNFGFAGGNYGSNSEAWYSPNIAWTAYPYGWAQPSPYNNPTNGFYDPYAGLMYYEADAYTFAFSERVTPDVGMSVSPGDTIRITILPDDRLDSPVPEAQTVTDNSITLAWKAVAGASNYMINILRPLGIPSVITNVTSYTFNNLLSGAPYVMSVQAMGTNNGNPIITPARPITAITTGPYNTVTGNLVKVSVALDGVVDPFSQLQTAYVNGIAVTPTNGQINVTHGYPNWMASVGTNQFPVQVVDQNNHVVFDDWASFVLSPPFTNTMIHTKTNRMSGTNAIVFVTNSIAYTIMTNFNFYGQLIGKTPSFAADAQVRGHTIPLSDASVVVGLLYAPIEIRKSNPLDVVVSGPPSVLISNVASSRLTGITFNFTIPNGTNYIVESSTNLMDWQTNSTGVGTGAQQSFTNADTSPAQFYRIKLP